jgi:hypothetical protein
MEQTMSVKREHQEIDTSVGQVIRDFRIPEGKWWHFNNAFSEVVRKLDDGSGCWVCEGPNKVDRYGVYWVLGIPAYQLSFELHNDYAPTVCRHLCGNHSCVNPVHLADGDKIDNKLDECFHSQYDHPKPLCPVDWGWVRVAVLGGDV